MPRRRQSLGSIAPRGRRKVAPKKTPTRRGIPPVAKGVGDLSYARKKQLERQVAARGGKIIKTAPKRTLQTRTKNGMPQEKGPDGIWRNKPHRKKNKR